MPRAIERVATLRIVGYPKDQDSQPRGTDDRPSSPDMPLSETRLATRPMILAASADEAWAYYLEGDPMVCVSSNHLRSLPLDPCAGFLLSLMDGTMDLETVVELSGMLRADALRMARALFESGVISFQ